MACSISISNVVAIESGGNLTSLTAHGAVTDCTELEVKVTCGSWFIQKTVAGSPTSGNWSAIFSATELVGFACTCGSQVRIDAICRMSALCSTWQLETIQCCPAVDIQVGQGDCKNDGTKHVTINATVTPGSNNTVPVQADLTLNGSVVDTGTASSSFATLNLAYSGDLASGNYSACVQVNQPDCGSECKAFAIACKGDGEDPECKKDYRKWFCPLVFAVMSISFATSIAFLILDNVCFSLPVIGNAGALLLLLGFLGLGLYYSFCQKCLCGWVQKLLWRVCFAVGMIITTFAGSCQTVLTPGLVLIVVGLLFLIWWIRLCKKSWCEVVQEMIFVIGTLILVPILFVLSLAALQAALLVLITIGSFAFTLLDLIILVLFSLFLYAQARC